MVRFSAISLLLVGSTQAFLSPTRLTTPTKLYAGAKGSDNERPLVLLTFDLDDTLYPIAPVIEEANAAFAKAMERYGYDGIQPNDIDVLTKKVRQELPPEEAAALSHTEAREMAIRRQMEDVLLAHKLSETAEDWVTAVEDLSPVVVENAKKMDHSCGKQHDRPGRADGLGNGTPSRRRT